MLIGMFILMVGIIILMVIQETVFFTIYKFTGGKKNYFRYWKWFLNNF